jgi:hypothetical protein
MLWTIWLERNRLCFSDYNCCNIKEIGAKIISLATFWCSGKGNILKLSLVLPQNTVNLLLQVLGEVTLALVHTQEEEEDRSDSTIWFWYQLINQCLTQSLSEKYSALLTTNILNSLCCY